MLKFFNTLTKSKDVFVPLSRETVRIYTCGPTVYNYAHIGNLSAYLFTDLLKKYLVYRGYCVIDVMNITDVDDKTIKYSREKNQTLGEFTGFYTEALFSDFEKLDIVKPKILCKATDHINDMIRLIQALLRRKVAYQAEDGSVYFKISAFDDYGKLSDLKKRKIKVGASGRIYADEYSKDNISDFVLWKAWQEKDGNNFWESPFGRGRPGWHIECSAMSMKNLGESFDIHTGAVDLIFPHHENEIAQSEAVTGRPFVKYWLHRGYLKVDGKKMSKSLGNFYTLDNILTHVQDPRAFRYLVLSNHYRANLNFTIASLESSYNALKKIRNFVARLNDQRGENEEFAGYIDGYLDTVQKEFISFMDDDLDTPRAMASIFNFIKAINSLIDESRVGAKSANKVIRYLESLDQVFGFALRSDKMDERTRHKIEQLVKERRMYREEKKWEEADQVKKRLSIMGIELKDEKNNTKWYIKI